MLQRIGGSALVLACVLGCAGGSVGSSSSDVSPASAPLTVATLVGEYALVAVNGHSLPYAPRPQGAAAATSAWSVVSGSFLVNPNGTFRLQTAFDQPAANSSAGSGTCYPEGNEVKMAWDGGGLTDVSLRGDTVMVKREGVLYAYLRSRK